MPPDDLLRLPLPDLLARLASDAPAPAGGALVAIAAAGAAAMVEMGATLTLGRERYAGVAAEMEHARSRARALRMRLVELVVEDGAAYTGVLEARRLPRDRPEERELRQTALDDAFLAAAGPPREMLAAATEIAELAALIAERGNANLLGDATTAALVGESAGRAAAILVELDAGASGAPGAQALRAEARADQMRGGEARTRALLVAAARRPRAR